MEHIHHHMEQHSLRIITATITGYHGYCTAGDWTAYDGANPTNLAVEYRKHIPTPPQRYRTDPMTGLPIPHEEQIAPTAPPPSPATPARG